MSTDAPILVCGATGHTGQHATKFLLKKSLRVRAFVHKNDERSRQLEALGAEIFVGDLLDLRDVRRAFEGGVKRAYFVYPILPGLVEATANFALAAVEVEAEVIVNMSQRSCRPDAASNNALQHWVAERVFDWAATPVVHLQPTVFNEWLFNMRHMIREGRYSAPFGPTGRFAPISTEDQGAVIAEILADPSGHAGQTYRLLGPIEVTPPEIAEIISKTLGKEVRYEQISAAQWVWEVFGVNSEFGTQHVQGIVEMHQKGLMGGTNNVVKEITGRSPEGVAEYVEKHRAVWLENKDSYDA